MLFFPFGTLQEGVAVEIAEAVAGALLGELSATAVNAPMVPQEVNKDAIFIAFRNLDVTSFSVIFG